MSRSLLRYFVGLACTVAASAAMAGELPWPVRLRQDLDRVAQLQWKLRRASGDRCAVASTDIGTTFDHREAYEPGDWPLLQASLGMSDEPVLVGVVPGSPAGDAGLASGDVVVAIGQVPTAKIVATRRSGESAAEVLDRRIAESPADQPISVVTRRAGVDREVQVMPVSHCGVRVILEVDKRIDAHSDGRDIAVTTGLVTFSENDDELAMAIAHEFGHAIGRHTANTGTVSRLRKEDEADVTGIQLAACAGFDPDKAMMLYRRLARRDVLAFLRAPTHRKFSTRIELMTSALAKGHVCPGS